MPGGHEGGGDGDGGDEPDAADQRPHDLFGDEFAAEHVAEPLAGKGEQDEQRQRRSGVGQYQRVDGRCDVIAADAQRHLIQLPNSVGPVGYGQLPHSRRLGDRDVVEDAERSDDHPAQEEPPQVDVAGQGPEVLALLRSKAVWWVRWTKPPASNPVRTRLIRVPATALVVRTLHPCDR